MSIRSSLLTNYLQESKKFLDDMPGLISTTRRSRPVRTTRCSWALGLCGAPDVPPQQIGQPPPYNKPQEIGLAEAVARGGNIRITFILRLTEQTEAVWETFLFDKKLYIQLPSSLLPDGSKEGFVTLLEYAEEELHCTDIIVCLKKDRLDRQQLVRTFMFLGFTVLPPGHALLPNPLDTINLYMRYSIE